MFSIDFILQAHSKQNSFLDQGLSGEEAPASTAGILREGQGASKEGGLAMPNFRRVNVKKYLCHVLLLAFFMFTYLPDGRAQDTIRLTNGEWAPYQSETLKHYGVVSHIVSETFQLEGVQVEYGFFPWARALYLAEIGDFDGTFVWFYETEREKWFYFSDPLVDVRYVFFHFKSYAFNWASMDDLVDLSIGVLLPTKLSQEFNEAVENKLFLVERAPTVEMNFRKLLAKRIDLLVTDVDAGYDVLNKQFTPEERNLITYHHKPVLSKAMYLLLSRKIQTNDIMIRRFNRGLKRLKGSGKYDQYFLSSQRGEYELTENN